MKRPVEMYRWSMEPPWKGRFSRLFFAVPFSGNSAVVISSTLSLTAPIKMHELLTDDFLSKMIFELKLVHPAIPSQGLVRLIIQNQVRDVVVSNLCVG